MEIPTVTFSNYVGPVVYKWWKEGDPLPAFSKELGVDTETELITDVDLTPPLVVMGVYNEADNTTYIVSYKDALTFLKHILERDIRIYLANAGFDYYELECPELQDAVSRNKVVDILIRGALRDIATVGFIRTYSLVDACHNYLNYEMDKHEDQGDQAARVTFRQDVPVTEEQCVYLAIDCMSTYYAGKAMGPQATEEANTRGAIVLYHISKNGFPVDRKVFDHFYNLLAKEKEKYRQELLTYGFPDPEDKNKPSETEQVRNTWVTFIYGWLDQLVGHHDGVPRKIITRVSSKRALVYLVNTVRSKQALEVFAKYLLVILLEDKASLTKKEQQYWDVIAEAYDLDCLETAIKGKVWPILLQTVMEEVTAGKDLDAAFDKFQEVAQEHPEFWVKQEKVSPKKFLQEKLTKLEQEYPGLKFDRTEKSQQLKCSKTDAWKLQDAGCKDPFLISYTNFGHTQKYMSTYTNYAYIRSDNRVRARYGLVTTARTNATQPNIQNLPSRDANFPLKNMFVPPEGMLLCSTDFSFAELVALAENCIQKYGFSVLGDIINAGICPHFFFAGVMLGKISPDVSFCKDPTEVKKVEEFLESNVTKQERQLAKAQVEGPSSSNACRRRK